MALDIEGFFGGLATHLRKRSQDITQIATMAAIEHWVQFEAAAFLARRDSREKYGIGGGKQNEPDWWLTCEYKKIDLYVEGLDSSHAIEFKAVHNNKNFYTKVLEARRDLEKHLAPEVGRPHSAVIAIVSHALYANNSRYKPLRETPRGNELKAEPFKELFKTELASTDPRYNGYMPTRITCWEMITSLEKAPYIVPGNGSFVALALIKQL